MQAGIYNISILKGATYSRVLTWTDENDAAIDLTGYTARLHMRTKKGASTTIVELTTENGGITLGGVAGTITLSISATDTAALSQECGVYDLEMVSGVIVTRLLEGTVTISDESTR